MRGRQFVLVDVQERCKLSLFPPILCKELARRAPMRSETEDAHFSLSSFAHTPRSISYTACHFVHTKTEPREIAYFVGACIRVNTRPGKLSDLLGA